MRLPRPLARLFRRRSERGDDDAHYAAADKLERTTQAHYRAVTGVDAKGRATSRGEDAPEKPARK